MEKERKAVESFIKKYADEGYDPVRWNFPDTREGCRSCSDTKIGPWFVTILSSVLEDRKEALFVVVTLCAKCMKDESICEEISDRAVSEYLAPKDQN